MGKNLVIFSYLYNQTTLSLSYLTSIIWPIIFFVSSLKYIITHIMPSLLKEDFIYYYGYHPDYASHKYEICVSNEIFDFLFNIKKNY